MSDSLWPHGLQHTRLPCPSPSPTACSNSPPHRVGDAIQPTHPLSSPSPPVLSLSQHQGLFQWVGSLHYVAKSFNLSLSPSKEYSGLVFFKIEWFDLLERVHRTLKSLLQHHNSKHQFFGTQPSLWSNSYICTWLLEKPYLWLYGPFSAKWCLCFLICCHVMSFTCHVN